MTVNDDGSEEADERFTVHLSNASGARRVDSQGVGTIVNDDASPPPPQPVVRQAQTAAAGGRRGGQRAAQERDGPGEGARPNRFVELEEGRQIPVGSVVDTTKGRVTIVAAGDQRGGLL